jgi:hypothetical protein
MGLLFSLLSALLAQAALPVEDRDFGCFPAAEAERYLRDFSVNVRSFGGLELCDSTKDTKKLLNDLYLIEKAEFVPGREHAFIRGFVARENYYGWMRSQTRGVRRGHDIPYATAYNSGGYFTMQDGWAALSTLGRVGTIIHEARHTAGYRHYPCTSGPYGGSSVSGCDTRYGQGGSHAVEMEYYARVVLEAKNLHPAYQSMARLMALGRSNFVFNESPVRRREALLAYDGRKALLVDGEQLSERPAPAVRRGDRLQRTSFGASLFDGQDARALDLYGREAGPFSDDYSYFKLLHSTRDRLPGLLAVEEIDLGNLRYLAALDREGKVYSYNFPRGAWHPASAPLAGARNFVTLTPSGRAGLFVVKEDGAMVPFDLATRRFGPELAERWPADISALARLGSRLLALRSDGRIVDPATGEDAFPSAGLFLDMVNVPLYDGFEVSP